MLRDRRLKSLLWLFFIAILVRNAWLCEDAFITYRVVDNWTHGFGMRWNTAERVQVYTHPLWMMLAAGLHYLARDVYFAGMVLSLVCSGAAVWLLLSRAMKSTGQCLVAIVLVTFSKAFVDFSTSGLENPLSHLLLLLFFLEYLKPQGKRSFRKMMRWTGFVLVTRMDLVWLLLPALAHVTWKNGTWRRRHWRGWLGLWPFFGWELFSLLYYGFLFPNSAYAKLTVHLPLRAILSQGLCYLLNSLAWDPLTLFTMTALVAWGFTRVRRDLAPALVSLGVVLYVVYLVRVGGDYMSGRFLTAPFLVSLMLLSRIELESLPELCAALAMALALGLCGPRPPILTREEYVGLGHSPQSVDDERGYRHDDTAFLRLNRDSQLSDRSGWVADGLKAKREHQRVIVYKNVGYFGFFAGPEVHVIDPYGIGDPLTARIPFDSDMGPWAAGHFYRQVPAGYREAAIDASAHIEDPALDAYWRKLELVTRGPILDRARLAMVARFNLGLEPIP